MYKSVICHLHSTFEGPASISGYCHEAAKHGIDAVWLSDHDVRVPVISRNFVPLFKKYDFCAKRDAKYKPAAKEPFASWELQDISPSAGYWLAKDEEQCHLSLASRNKGPAWGGATLRLNAHRKSERRPLISNPEIIMDICTNIKKSEQAARIIIRIYLSQVPPDHEQAYIDCIIGPDEGRHNAIALEHESGKISLDIADYARKLNLGLDHTFTGLSIRTESRNWKKADITLQGLEIATDRINESELLEKQKKMGRETGKKYGVCVLVGYEISGGEYHMTYFGDNAPIYPYKDEKKPAAEVLTRYVKKYSGITSINHPFNHKKRETLTETEKLHAIEEKADEIIRRAAYSSRLIEIGFPNGRHGFSPDHYLSLWDRLNTADLPIAGMGVSDAHENCPWEKGNNFANYIASTDCSLKNLLSGMEKGNFYMADPCRFKGTLALGTDRGKTMGDTQKGGYLKIKVSQLQGVATARWIADGKCVKTSCVSGNYTGRLDISAAKHFVRFELRDATGRLLMLTNPLWTARRKEGTN